MVRLQILRCPLFWRIRFLLKTAVPQSNYLFRILYDAVQRRTGADLLDVCKLSSHQKHDLGIDCSGLPVKRKQRADDRSYFNTSIPDALFEAAKIDGAGHMKIFTSITLPLGKPILVTMGLFSALGYWNDWTNGLYYLSGNDGQKLYSIQNLLNQMITDIQYLASGKVTGNIGAEVAKLPTTSIRMAIAFIAMLPLFIIYPFLQKYFAEGITLGAVKG